jgi:hypothetical protein
MTILGAYYSYIHIRIRYTLGADSLIVKSAFSKVEIKYSQIWTVEETIRPFFPGPSGTTAPGKYRIRIVYNEVSEIFVSPERIDEFLSKLKMKLPDPRMFKEKEGWK